MLKLRYKNDIKDFLEEFENGNIKAKVTGIAFLKLIRDELPHEALRRMSMYQQYADDPDSIEGLRQVVNDKVDF